MHSCPVSSFSGRSLHPSNPPSVPFHAPQHLLCVCNTGPSFQHSFPLFAPSFSSRSYLIIPSLFLLLLFSSSFSPRLAIVHPRRLLSYYFVGARGQQVYLSFYTALLSSLLSPRSPHINIAALSERFIALRSPPAEGISRDHPEEGGESRIGAGSVSCTKRACARARVHER